MEDIQCAWLVMEAEAGNRQAIKDAFLLIAHYHSKGLAPPQPLIEWLAKIANSLAKVDVNHRDPAKVQRAVTNALGFVRSGGRPKKYA